MDRVVGIGEMYISNNINDTIKTFALATCVGVVAYSSRKKVGGMIHIMLPNPSEEKKLNMNPLNYASTGVPILIENICNEYGCLKGELNISVYGGAESKSEIDFFHIGEKNIKEVKDSLNRIGLQTNYEDVGGKVSRTIELSIETGEIKASYQNIRL